MLDKQVFYHGAALVCLLEDQRCQKVQKYDFGYTVNEEVFIFLKYTTKSRSPWRFSFNENEIEHLNSLSNSFRKIVLALICGGDGICAILWRDGKVVLDNKTGWVSAKRGFNEQYGVAGSGKALKRKVSLRQWPSLIFENQPCQITQETD